MLSESSILTEFFIKLSSIFIIRLTRLNIHMTISEYIFLLISRKICFFTLKKGKGSTSPPFEKRTFKKVKIQF